jgi:hypothetical protein
MRILLVSDSHPYSTFDVFKGYCNGFAELKIPFETVNLVELLDTYSPETAMGMLLAKTLIKSNAFTHVLYVAGTMIPKWVLESKYDKQIGFIATDDPHSSKMLLENKDCIDYYFTNEKAIENKRDKIFYIPTAVSSTQLNCNKDVGNNLYKSDVCFIGSVYPNRVKPLEDALRWCIKNNKIAKILGPIRGRTTYGELFVPENSIIHQYGINTIVDNKETNKYYANAKVVINMDRDVNWSPAFSNANPHLYECIPYSSNPRVYEIAACKTIQLFINPRQEIEDTFGDNIYQCCTDTISKTLDTIFSTKESILKKKISNCYDIVKKNHTYTHRAASIINYLIRE